MTVLGLSPPFGIALVMGLAIPAAHRLRASWRLVESAGCSLSFPDELEKLASVLIVIGLVFVTPGRFCVLAGDTRSTFMSVLE